MNTAWNDINSPVHPLSAPDYLPSGPRRRLQLHRLRAIVEHARDHVALHRDRMRDRDIQPADIRSLEDIAALPFTVKTDLRDAYPYGLFATPLNDIVRLHASSGTTGKPIVVAYTRNDMNVWTSVMLRTFVACGLRGGDIIQNAYGYGLFTGGLGAHYGAEALGATVIPISGGNTERQIMVMKDFGATAICCTPSYFLHLIEIAKEQGIRFEDMPLRLGIFGAEPWTDSMRQRIQEDSGIRALDMYGLSEIIGPGVASECEAQNGLHVFEDHFYPEIVDPETGTPVPDGDYGELVITTLTKQAMPMLRYRTRDITRILTDPCPCGRTLRRIERVSARSDDMLIVRGINVFPSQVEAALLSIDNTLPHYQIVVSRKNGLDVLEVRVEVTAKTFGDEVRTLEALRQRIAEALLRTIGLRVEVTLVEPRTLQRSEGKAKRVLDLREP